MRIEERRAILWTAEGAPHLAAFSKPSLLTISDKSEEKRSSSSLRLSPNCAVVLVCFSPSVSLSVSPPGASSPPVLQPPLLQSLGGNQEEKREERVTRYSLGVCVNQHRERKPAAAH